MSTTRIPPPSAARPAAMSARPHWVSPSLAAMPDGTVPAYEMKFAVPPDVAAAVQDWAAARLTADPHTDPARGGYGITSVYYDTPEFSVFHRAPGFDVHKYRVRRYGRESVVHLERKSKQDGRVWKCRATVPQAALDKPTAEWGVPWFIQELTDLHLRPVCCVTYERSAFVGTSSTGPIRLTLDRTAVGVPTSRPHPEPLAKGIPLLTDEVVIEFKFLASMPALFKEGIEAHRLTPTTMSKYRRCARTAKLVPESGPLAPRADGDPAV